MLQKPEFQHLCPALSAYLRRILLKVPKISRTAEQLSRAGLLQWERSLSFHYLTTDPEIIHKLWAQLERDARAIAVCRRGL